MYNSVYPLQRSGSLGRTMHPRVAYCSVVWKPSPTPPVLQQFPPLPRGISNAQYENGSCDVERDVLRMIDTMRARQEREATERAKRAEAAAARALRDDEELRDAELKAAFDRADAANQSSQSSNAASSNSSANRDAPSTVRVAAPVVATEVERIRRIEQAYREQKATVQAFEQPNHINPSISQPNPPSISSVHVSPSVSPAPPDVAVVYGAPRSVDSNNANSVAVQEFQSITGVTDRSASSLLLSLCDNDLDRAVGLYFDNGQIQGAVDRAIVLNERRLQQ